MKRIIRKDFAGEISLGTKYISVEDLILLLKKKQEDLVSKGFTDISVRVYEDEQIECDERKHYSGIAFSGRVLESDEEYKIRNSIVESNKKNRHWLFLKEMEFYNSEKGKKEVEELTKNKTV